MMSTNDTETNADRISEMGGFDVNVPNQKFWTITPFRFSLPDGWRARQTVEALAYMERGDTTTTNCSIRWQRVPFAMELKVIAQAQRKNLARIDAEAKIGFSRTGLLNGKMSYAHVAEYTAPGEGDERGAKKGQYYVAFFGPRLGAGQPLELFEMIGNFNSEDDGHLEQLQEIVASFHFNLAPAAVADDTGAAEKGA